MKCICGEEIPEEEKDQVLEIRGGKEVQLREPQPHQLDLRTPSMRVIVEYDPDRESASKAEKLQAVIGSMMPALESAEINGTEVSMTTGQYIAPAKCTPVYLRPGNYATLKDPYASSADRPHPRPSAHRSTGDMRRVRQVPVVHRGPVIEAEAGDLVTVDITCKDKLIEQHCQHEFGPLFQDWYDNAKTAGGRELALRRMHQRLRKEAQLQQWFDWVATDEDQTDWKGNVIGKKREVVLGDDGKPVLLIPEVRIVDGGDG